MSFDEPYEDNANLSRADWLRIVVVGIAFAALIYFGAVVVLS